MNKPLNIAVSTHPNGYNLNIEGHEYYYYSLETLLQGIAYHAVDDLKYSVELEDMANLINSHITFIKTAKKDTERLLAEIDERNGVIKELQQELGEVRSNYNKLLRKTEKKKGEETV